MKRWALFGMAVLAWAGTAAAQQWPTRPVHVIVNVGAGGIADVTARLLSVRLSEQLGQQVVVENKPGGEGYIGFEQVARAEPDGHMLVFSPGSSMMITPHLVRRPDFDPTKMLAPVAATGRVSLYLEVPSSMPVQNLKEFVAYAKANAGKLNYGTPGTGTSPHIAAEVFKRDAGIQMTHIPYKGAGPAMKDLLGGQFQVMFDPGIGLENVKAGKLRMLAVSSAQRHPDFPNVPTFAELGYKDVDGGPHFGYYAPAKTPRAIIDRLNREVAKAMADPENRKRLQLRGLDFAPPMTPDEFAAYVGKESASYARLLPTIGVKPE
jgi:tripartite-type tricarboxylate transporter receptor subunit TctC